MFGEAKQKRREETTSVAELFAEQGSRGKKPRARRTEAESRRFAERNKRRKLAVSRRFNFSELIPKLGAGGSLAAYGGRGTRHGRTKKTRNGMNGTVSRLGLGNEIYKRASPVSESVQSRCNFHPASSRSSTLQLLFSRLHRFYSVSLSLFF